MLSFHHRASNLQLITVLTFISSLSLSMYVADVNVSSFGHWTALHHAASNLNDKSISALLELKADPNIMNDDLWSPLMLVLNAPDVHPNKRARMVSALTQHNVDVNVKGPKNITPLMIASLKCKADIVQMLLEQGAAWDDVEDVKQNTPLHFSTIQGDVEAVRMILEKNAQNEAVIDKQNKWGYTALMYCAFLGSEDHLKIAALLLDDGADWDLVDHADMSAYKIASTQKNILFLQENGVPMAKADVADPAILAAIKASQERTNRLGQSVRERERDLEEIREAEAQAEANRIQRELERDKEQAEAIAAQEAYEKEAREAREADLAAAAAKKKEEEEAIEAAREQREAEEAALAHSKERQEAEEALKEMNEAEKDMKAKEGQEGYDAAKQRYEEKKASYEKELAEAEEAKIVADREKAEAVEAEKKRKEAEMEAKKAAEIAVKENKEADEALLIREKEQKEADEAAAMLEAAKKAEENLEKQIESNEAALEKEKAELEAEMLKLEELHDAAEDGNGVIDEDGNLNSVEASGAGGDFDTEGNPMLHKGILQKKADLMGTWKNRQFVLEKGILRFYENHSNDYPFGTKFKNFMLVDETMSIFTADNPEKTLMGDTSDRSSNSTLGSIGSRMTMFGGGSAKAKPLLPNELLIVSTLIPTFWCLLLLLLLRD